jgi:hypothetical protein
MHVPLDMSDAIIAEVFGAIVPPLVSAMPRLSRHRRSTLYLCGYPPDVVRAEKPVDVSLLPQ